MDKEIEYDLNEYYLTNLTRRPSVEIVNNTVNSHLARAYLIKTGNVHIHGNFINGSSGTAIHITIYDNIINALCDVAIYVSYTNGVNIYDNKITGSLNAVSIEKSDSVIVGNNGSLPVLMNN